MSAVITYLCVAPSVFKVDRRASRFPLVWSVSVFISRLAARRSLDADVVSVHTLSVYHSPRTDPQRHPSILSERGQRVEPPPRGRPGEEVAAGVRGPWRRGAEPGGDAAGAGADGGQRLLAAVQEGRVVGALLAAVVIIRLTLPLPATAQDPDEGLNTQHVNN